MNGQEQLHETSPPEQRTSAAGYDILHDTRRAVVSLSASELATRAAQEGFEPYQLSDPITGETIKIFREARF